MSTALIAGAGPVGLWLACELRLRGIDAVVIEPRTERDPHSKALTIHPRTLEIFAQRGVVEEFLERGIRVPAGHFGALESRLDFKALDTAFPFTLVYPQAETERILEERALSLGADVRRGHRVTGLVSDTDQVQVTIDDSAGNEYCLETEFLCGCDGSGSTVRKAASIGFEGHDANTFGILADVQLSERPASGYSFSGITGQLMVVPMPGGLYRIVGIDASRQDPTQYIPDFDEFRSSVLAIAGTDFGMHSPVWISRYGNASRIAIRYGHHRVALAGDAAHIHFPAGGVGMNVGIHDAHALGWRIADILTGLAPMELIEDYHAERHAVGEDLILGTQAQTAVLAAYDPDRQALRALLNTLINDVPELSAALANRLSGLSVVYPAPPGAHRSTGRRVVTGDTTDALLRRADINGNAIMYDPQDQLTPGGDADLLAQNIVRVVADSPAESAAAMLVRPDGHIAWAQDNGITTPDLAAAIAHMRHRQLHL